MSALVDQRRRIHFALFRISLGAYLGVFFLRLVPYGVELYGRDGMLPDGAANYAAPITPDLLGPWDSAGGVLALLAVAALVSIPLALGVGRRLAAALVWLTFLALFFRNNYTRHVAIDYLGWMLLVCVVVPGVEGRFPWREKRSVTRGVGVLGDLHLCVWVVAAVGYAISGWLKLGSPLWRDGTALSFALSGPLGSDGFLAGALLTQPLLLRLATWIFLATELLALPFALWHRSRPVVWALLTSMHLGIALLLNLGEIPIAMLVFQLLLFDVRWLPEKDVRWLPGKLSLASGD